MAAILFDLDGVFYEGDRPVDGGAEVVGWARDKNIPGIKGILVKTGKFRPQDLEGDITPAGVLDSVAGLPQWWQNTHRY